MKKGGYQIIDLSAYKFTNGEAQIIVNVYNTLKNTKKVVLVSGLTVDNTEYHDMFAVFIPYETYFYGLAQYEGNNIYFVVNNDGSVTVNVAEAKQQIDYLYNGVQLPELPAWDEETYPYAFIGKIQSITYLAFTADITYTQSTATIRYMYATEGATVYKFTNNKWEYYKTTTEDDTFGVRVYKASGSTGVVWGNFDVLNQDGTVFLAASDPVPANE